MPVQLAAEHRQALAGKPRNTRTTRARQRTGWWLTLRYEEAGSLQTPTDAPVMGVEVGIAHGLTTATGQQYRPFQGQLAPRHQRDREQRRRTAKLRACLTKKGFKRLPSPRNPKLARTVHQEINRAVNALYQPHPEAQVA